MLRKLFLAALFSCSTAPLAAQEWTQIAYYLAYIGPEDMYNSSGARVDSLGGVLQQDRANFHRFGVRHAQDQGDPIFASREWRAQIPAMVAAGGNDRGDLARMARGGQPFMVNVFVCGYGNAPSVIYLAGAGEDHSGCY
ncbi:hypothetical protein AB1M95_18390 [Sulfitobacter sp. LCG007]